MNEDDPVWQEVLRWLVIALTWLGLSYLAVEEANAAPRIDAVTVSLASYHPGNRSLNESNPGILLHAGPWMAGAYRNSYSETTALVAYTHPMAHVYGVSVGLTVGAVTGYKVPAMAALTVGVGPLFVLATIGESGPVFGFGLRQAIP